MPCIMAIDPGLTGAWCIMGIKTGKVFGLGDMPTMAKNKGQGKNQINGLAFGQLIVGWKNQLVKQGGICHAYIELAQPMPKQGVSSTFTIGHTAGMIEGIVAASRIPYTLVSAAAWKKVLVIGSDKEVSRAMAIRLYPDQEKLLSRKSDHNRAEALLIAHWARTTQRSHT